MDIAKIDYWATSGGSIMHKATVYSKLAASALAVATVVISRDIVVLLSLYAVVLITVRASKLPLKAVIAISLYPAIFAVLFAVSQAGSGWMMPAAIIMKAVTAATAMLLLVSTTPYTEVMGVARRFLPRVVADGLFMTYRSFFILIKFMDHFIDALRLRGGLKPGRFVKNASNMAPGIGMLFIRAFDSSQRLYDVMSLRGYSGRLSGARPSVGLGINDIPYPLMTSIVFLQALCWGRGGCHAGHAAMPVLLAVYFAGMEGFRAWKR